MTLDWGGTWSVDYRGDGTKTKLDKKLDQVALTVSLRGIRMEDCSTGDLHFEFSIYRLDTSFNWF